MVFVYHLTITEITQGLAKQPVSCTVGNFWIALVFFSNFSHLCSSHFSQTLDEHNRAVNRFQRGGR